MSVEAEALWFHILTPGTVQPIREAVDAGCVNNRQIIPLIHDSHTVTGCTNGSAASLLKQRQRV